MFNRLQNVEVMRANPIGWTAHRLRENGIPVSIIAGNIDCLERVWFSLN